MWRIQIAVAVIGCGAFIAGCGRLQSADGHIRNSMWANGDDVDYVNEDVLAISDRSGQVSLPDIAAEDIIIDDEVRPPHALPENVEFLSHLYREVIAMRDDVMRLTTRAQQKGAAGRAALDPKLRSFHTSVQLINRYVVQFYDADALEWESLKVKIDVEIDSARAALREAAKAIDRVKDEGHLIEV